MTECRYSGASRGIGGIRALGAPRGCRVLGKLELSGEHWVMSGPVGVSGVHWELAVSVGTQRPAGVEAA